jgi:hypothetical protein
MGISTDKRLKGNISTPEIKGGQIVLTGPRGVGIEKIEKTTSSGVEDTYTITYTDGQTSNFIVKNGLPLEFNWDGTKLGIRVQGQTDYSYTDLKGSKGDTGAQGPKGEQGKAFTYDMFTEEQLKALTGPKGEQGAPNMYKYKEILTADVAKGGTITLPCYYKVGTHCLDVYYMGELLILSSDDAGSDGHYREVGEANAVSNKIKLTTDWAAEANEYFEFIVRR